ncbi:MAG: Protein-glutamate methylesterase/protein-glutamine glutaminase [Chroococcopsis gigantea SAG 12.99]|nr:Protein-glutamate methylesterase/protein-glutamine glutaminase [Chroococcopsis gigantea SAG 12.99]
MNPLAQNKDSLVLIVDDDTAIRSLLTLAIEEEGYQVEEATNGEEAIAKYIRLRPDAILLDALMPKMDGFACCQHLRALPGGESTPILMITFLDDQESIEQAFAAGATDYITKPIHWEVLSQRVNRLIEANFALKNASSINDKLRQQQTWENLYLDITTRLCQSRPLTGVINACLTYLQTLLQVDRVVIRYGDNKLFQELYTPASSSVEFLSFSQLSQEETYLSYYLQCQPVVIDNIHESELSSGAIATFTELNTGAMLIAPLLYQNQLQGVICAHTADAPHQWDDSLVKQFSLLANILSLSLSPQR